ncbi:MAG: cysteine desulfurase family protein [Elusimicrobiota bacterium]
MIYLDHNATTPVRPEVLDAMLPFLKDGFGNPNSVYLAGQRTRKAVEDARRQVAALLNCKHEDEVVFTSCGSESDVLAISGGAWQAFDDTKGARRRLVSSPIEHDAVRGQLTLLKRRGFELDLLAVDRHGLVDPGSLAAVLGPQTALVSVMHANNEVGTIQPIAQLAALSRAQGALFHTDAVQSAGKVPIDVQGLGVDLLAISGHKLNAPKGVGALYVRRGVRLVQGITGHQEKNRRGGTENVASIVGFGKACELAAAELDASARHYETLRAKLIGGFLQIPGTRLNGHPEERLANCAHFSISGVDGHHLVVALDLEGICVSAGPACSSGSSLPSHVLTAMGVDAKLATGSLRVSFGWSSTEADIDRLLAALRPAIEKLRRVPAGSL